MEFYFKVTVTKYSL